MESGLTEIKNHPSGLVKVKQERLIKPHGGGILGRLAVTAGGITIGYLLLPTVPLASLAIAGALALSYLQDADKIQHPETAKRLELLLHSRTAKHPSIYESRKELKTFYPIGAVNRAIEYMLDYCDWVEFSPQSRHPLRVFGEIYVFIDPIDEQVYLPIDGLKMLMQRWQVDDSITVAAATLPTVEPQAVGSAVSKTLAPAATLPTYKGVPILPGDRTTLLNRLKEQCPELLKLVKSPPIRLVGLQRTGKSTFACKLALLRALLLEGHTTLWATPHREINNRVPEVLNPIGTTAEGAKDFAAIEAHWSTIQAQIDQGQPLNLTAVWDEFGDYDQFQNTDLLGSSLRSLLRESTKHGYFPVLVVHGDQASFLPGVKNILTTLQQSTIKVETIGEQANEFGEMKPTGWVQITWLDGTQSAFKTPEWLTVEYLLTLVRSNTKPVFMAQLKPESKPVQSTPKSHGSERDRLEQLFGKSPADLVDNQESEQVVRFDLFEELARVMTPVDPMFADFVLWLKTKQGQTLSKRDMILLWGNKKDRGVASNEKIQPFIDKAIANTLLAEVDGSYRVFNHVV